MEKGKGNLWIGAAGALLASSIGSVVVWGIGVETRLEQVKIFMDKGERFTREEALGLQEAIQENHDLELVIDTKLDFLIKEVDEIKERQQANKDALE